jgi:hypothetical protein
MRLFGGQFLGQAATFVYLTQASPTVANFSPVLGPQFSIYNFLVASFWPIYWIGFALDRAKTQAIYGHVFTIAHERAAELGARAAELGALVHTIIR